MRRAVSLFLVVAGSWCVACAQGTPPPQSSLPNFNFGAPPVIMGDWWRDPHVSEELRLSETQKKQLEQASLNMKLSLISAAANGASAVIKAESALNCDTLDEMSYEQQVNATADAAARLIKDVGTSLLAMRKILTPEQWQKLNAMRSTPNPQAQRPQARRWEQQGNQRP